MALTDEKKTQPASTGARLPADLLLRWSCEAQNAKGELFGFERAQEISTRSAAAIVEAAKAFGQADDITVVAITRMVAISSAVLRWQHAAPVNPGLSTQEVA